MSSSAYSSCTSRKNSSSNTSNFSVFELISNKNKKQQQQQSSTASTKNTKNMGTTINSPATFSWLQHRTSYPTSDYSSSIANMSQELNESMMSMATTHRTSTSSANQHNTTSRSANGTSSSSHMSLKRFYNRADTADLVTIPAASEKEEENGGHDLTTTTTATSTNININSGHRARLLSLVLQSPRRFSCNSDTSDGVVSATGSSSLSNAVYERPRPFWVPAQIAERSKPRSSLPNTHVVEINEAMLGFMHQTPLNSG